MTATPKFSPPDVTPAQLANALRMLAADAVETAKSGHPGMPLGMADIAEVVWRRHLRHNPGNPSWPDRDRFVLSNGHGSMLLYALLHLTGYDLPIGELKRFRQLHSKTPGTPRGGAHPRHRDHHGPARPGPRQRGRHGARREAPGRALQPRRPRDRRSPHVRVRRRRLPDGGRVARSLLARRHARAGEARRALRRQRHLDRRPRRRLVPRRHAEALRGLRLERDPRRRRPRCGGRGSRGARGDVRRPADAGLLPHRDRQGRAEQGRHARRARCAARRAGAGRAPRSTRLAAPAVRSACRDRGGMGRPPARRGARGGLAAALRRLRRRSSRARGGVPARDLPHAARALAATRWTRSTTRRARRRPVRRASPRRTCSTTWSPRCRSSSAVRPT